MGHDYGIISTIMPGFPFWLVMFCAAALSCCVLVIVYLRERRLNRRALDAAWNKLSDQAFIAEKRNRLTLRISTVVGSGLDPNSVFPQILDLLSRYFENSALFLLVYRGGQSFSCVRAHGSGEEILESPGLAAMLSQAGIVPIDRDLADALDVRVDYRAACYSVPIVSGDKFAGSLLVCTERLLETGDQRFLVDLVPSLAAALRNQLLTERFGRAVDVRVRDHLLSLSGTAPGEVRNAGILFVDLVGFTSQAERLSPASIVEFLNVFFTRCQTIIFNRGGIINKFLGDGFMAIFNAPNTDSDFKEHMLQAGYDIMRIQGEFAELAVKYGIKNFAVALGAESGPVLAGIIGSNDRLEYTLMGDVVNVASRLEGLTRFFGVSFLVGEALRNGMANWCFRNLGRIRPKGKEAALGIFELAGPAAELDTTRIERIRVFEEGLGLYQAGKFVDALAAWASFPPDYSDRALDWYRSQAEEFRKVPPPAGWDGSETFRNK